MCANAAPSTSHSPFTTSSRAFFSRLTSPLKKHARNLTEFEIRPDEPYRKYSPGDLVKGAVRLGVDKPIRLTHLTVCLHGYVRVFKNPNSANDPVPDPAFTSSTNPNKSQYFGNGHASLFQDESTLCGEGRLEVGVYDFNFELEFPSRGVPTSIDFERGTISYLITATITRPTSITATSSCDQKLSLVETVDVGLVPPPKPRTISLEPISKRTRRKKSFKAKDDRSRDNAETSPGVEVPRAVGSPLPDDSASQVGTMDHYATPRSPIPSDIQSTVSAANSTDSAVSSSTGLSFRLGPVPSNVNPNMGSHRSNSKLSVGNQTITATIELLKSGCLPGDTLPLKISIKHTKAIKSLHGIIITLYRSGRVDSAPPLSMFGEAKGKEAERMKHNEYYPKSKTGLGGLSLSSAGSSSMFRKDLAQTFAPILVDPVTLTARTTASVRVPEDAFPTIRGVPGEMISFKYHVEVVIDLGGKLAGQQRSVPRVGAVSSMATVDNNNNTLTAWGVSIINTANLRREKSVVACLFEIVVGTTDSARQRLRAESSVKRQIDEWSEGAAAHMPPSHEPIYEESATEHQQNGWHDHEQNPDPYEQSYDHQYGPQYHEYDPHDDYDYNYYPDHYPPPALERIDLPPPEIQHEEGLSDKERARRAEERLLPSQPPIDAPGPSSSGAPILPSVPPEVPVEEEEDIYSPDDITPIAQLDGMHLNHGSVPNPNANMPSAPALEDLDGSTGPEATEDKRELERQRLLAEASTPSDFPRDEDEGAGGSGSENVHEAPSAPVLHDDEFEVPYVHHVMPGSSHRDTLPKYER